MILPKEFRRREEIRHRVDEHKRQDSVGTSTTSGSIVFFQHLQRRRRHSRQLPDHRLDLTNPFPSRPSLYPPVTNKSEQWQDRLKEHSWRQQEKFREEQAALEVAIMKTETHKIISKEEVIKVFTHHESL